MKLVFDSITYLFLVNSISYIMRGNYSKMNLTREHSILNTLLVNVSSILKNNSIEYYLIGGSAIGAVRDSKIIPWDDDIDIGIRRKDFYKALKLLKELELNLAETKL